MTFRLRKKRTLQPTKNAQERPRKNGAERPRRTVGEVGGRCLPVPGRRRLGIRGRSRLHLRTPPLRAVRRRVTVGVPAGKRCVLRLQLVVPHTQLQ